VIVIRPQEHVDGILEWEENKKSEGVVAFIPNAEGGSIVVFPSKNGFLPFGVPGAQPRFSQPGVGVKEHCILRWSDDARCYFAYPRNELSLEELRGCYHIVNGNKELALVKPFGEESRVCAWKTDNGILMIAVQQR